MHGLGLCTIEDVDMKVLVAPGISVLHRIRTNIRACTQRGFEGFINALHLTNARQGVVIHEVIF